MFHCYVSWSQSIMKVMAGWCSTLSLFICLSFSREVITSGSMGLFHPNLHPNFQSTSGKRHCFFLASWALHCGYVFFSGSFFWTKKHPQKKWDKYPTKENIRNNIATDFKLMGLSLLQGGLDSKKRLWHPTEKSKMKSWTSERWWGSYIYIIPMKSNNNRFVWSC